MRRSAARARPRHAQGMPGSMSSSISGTLSTLITATSSHLWNFGQLRQSLKTLCGSELVVDDLEAELLEEAGDVGERHHAAQAELLGLDR